MKSVVFCGSIKYYDQMKEFGDYLSAYGVTVYLPKPFSKSEDDRWNSKDESVRNEFAYSLTTGHFEKIKQSDVAFIFNPNGYSGNSTTLELGCAAGAGLQIFALEKDIDEICRDVLIERYFQTKEELLEALKA